MLGEKLNLKFGNKEYYSIHGIRGYNSMIHIYILLSEDLYSKLGICRLALLAMWCWCFSF